MKKIFLTALLISVFGIPVSAVCSITGGACSFDPSSYNQENPSQNLLNTIQNNRTESLNNRYSPNFYNPEWNTYQKNIDNNSNCQFGICLPQTNQPEKW